MKVSVIIPTFNRSNKLCRAYQSVCQQTRKPEEVIIIDDGSYLPINLEKKELYCIGIKTIIKRNKKNLGACQARNLGAKIATGDILMFLDDDDTWESQKIAAQIAVFESDSKIGLVYSGRLIVEENKRDDTLYKIVPQASGNIYPQILYKNLIGTTSSVAILKSLFDRVQGFDSKLSGLQDHDLWIRACQKTLVAHDNDCNVKYTISLKPKLQISSNSTSYTKAVNQIIEKYNQEIENEGKINSRKIKASFYFFAAKSCRFQGFYSAINWIIKSFLQYPSLKILLILLPMRKIYLLQKIIANIFIENKKLLTMNNEQ